MKIEFLRFVDKYVGFVACALLTVINRCVPNNPIIEKEKVKKTLFMKFWGLGSIILLAPAVSEFKQTFRQSKVVFVTLSRNKEISEALGLFDEILIIDVDSGLIVFVRTLLKTILYFWRESFDLVVDFEFFTRFSSVLTFLTFAKVKVGYHAWETWRGNIHNIKVPFNRYWHIVDNFNNLCISIGVPRRNDLRLLKPAILTEDKEYVDSLLKICGISRRIISVHVNASDLVIERRWPYDNFIQLINRIISAHDVSIVFIGSKSEFDLVKEIESKIHHPSVANFAAKLSIRQLAYVFEKSTLVISNDSGPLHLAVTMQTPTVSFFGPETPVMYGPKGAHHTVFYKNLDCSPCINVHDRKSVHCYWTSPRCMETISVDEVYNVINEKLLLGK